MSNLQLTVCGRIKETKADGAEMMVVQISLVDLLDLAEKSGCFNSKGEAYNGTKVLVLANIPDEDADHAPAYVKLVT